MSRPGRTHQGAASHAHGASVVDGGRGSGGCRGPGPRDARAPSPGSSGPDLPRRPRRAPRAAGPRRSGDLGDGRLERLGVARRRLAEAADLADVLAGGGLQFAGRRGLVGATQGLDASAHARRVHRRATILLGRRAAADGGWSMTSVRVPDFSPAVNGLHFPNAFPPDPIASFRLGDIATLSIGDASKGLCGGMAYTVRDLHEAKVAPPARPGPAARRRGDVRLHRRPADRQHRPRRRPAPVLQADGPGPACPRVDAGPGPRLVQDRPPQPHLDDGQPRMAGHPPGAGRRAPVDPRAGQGHRPRRRAARAEPPGRRVWLRPRRHGRHAPHLRSEPRGR